MEESQTSGTIMADTSSDRHILAANLDEEANAPTFKSRVGSGESGHKDGELNWEIDRSPERTTSLLPPFGAGLPLAHLPTPQSPGDLTNYMSASAVSPLSMEHQRPGHVHYPSYLRPLSRPTGVKSPKISQRSQATPPFKILPVFSVSEELKDNPRPSRDSLFDEIEFSRPPASQVATPSPEVFRIRRASVPSTASDAESLLATPQPGKRSSSHPYTAPTSLAPAPIISPANSSHSTYHASPEIEGSEPQSSRMHGVPFNMATLTSKHRTQLGVRDQGYYDLDDPFIVRDEALSRKRYLSPPPPKMHHELCATHTSTSSLQNGKARRKTPLENSIAKLIMSPSESSDVLSHGSPVKAEVDDRHYIDMEPPVSPIINSGMPSHTPMSPRTPQRVGSSRISTSEPQTSILENSIFQTPPPPSGGEIERIRQRQALVDETRFAENEKRRPDYMMRIKRARDSADEEAAQRERENALPGLGVTISPFRGRRLKLYQPVAVTSNVALLEEPGTETDEAPEPKTPPPISSMPSWQTLVPSMSLRAINWHTPRRGRSSPVAWTEEDERKKQKRLQAFAAPEPSGKGRRLKPAEVVGQGRVIIDIMSEESRRLAEDGILQLLETPETEGTELPLGSGHGAEWPDKEYPWSVQERQRDECEEAWRRQRLTWIERFLDRESESEDEENECVPGPSSWNQQFDPDSSSRLQRGHGKTISVNAIPNSKQSKSVRQITFNAANTDAREVLLSKKHVRAVAERLRKRRIAQEEEGVVMCICQGADDGRPMVRCDECRTWYHLICMDIHDESELGDEWYCWKCLPSAEDPMPAPTEPTFAPAMPDSPPRAGVGDRPLYQSPLQPSPMPASPISRRKADRSPTGGSRLPHPLGDPGDPVRGGPSTPYHSRVSDSRLYMTPKLFEEDGMEDHALFDPMSTPSRGLKFPNPVPITPRRPHPWTPAPLSWMTPSGPPRAPQLSAQSGSSSTRSLAYSLSTLEESVGPLTSPWPDSPTRKPQKGTDLSWPYPSSRRLLDSPLAVREPDHRSFLPGIDESPTHRYFRGKDTERTSSAGHSPRRD